MTPPALHRHPAWFGSVMGTAALSLAFLQESAFVVGAPFTVIADALLVVASALALVLLPRYLGRARDRAALAQELAAPAHGAMLATFPAGLLVLAVAWARVGSEWLGSNVGLAVSAVLVIAGAVVAIALSVVWASAQGRGDVDLAGVNGGWLIPPVMSLIVPLSIAPQMVAHPDQAGWLLAIGLGFYGVGAFLFLAIFALLIARLALRPPLPHAMSPSLWIPLAPSGILGLALLRLMQAGAETGLVGFVVLLLVWLLVAVRTMAAVVRHARSAPA